MKEPIKLFYIITLRVNDGWKEYTHTARGIVKVKNETREAVYQALLDKHVQNKPNLKIICLFFSLEPNKQY